jgi:hypothetical protein
VTPKPTASKEILPVSTYSSRVAPATTSWWWPMLMTLRSSTRARATRCPSTNVPF